MKKENNLYNPELPEIHLVSTCAKFQQIAKEKLKADDKVLELGSAYGDTTRAIAKNAAQVICFEIAPEIVSEAKNRLKKLENVEIICHDARDIARVKLALNEPDAIFIDIGGNALADNVITLLRQCLKAFSPRLIAVRSHELAEIYANVVSVETPKKPILVPTKMDGSKLALDSFIDLSYNVRRNSRRFAYRNLKEKEALELITSE